MILSLPALEYVRTEYTEVWTPARTVPLIRFADRVRAISSTGLDLVGITNDAAVLRSLGEFDEIVSWYGANRPEFREALAHLSCKFLEAVPSGADVHATDFYLGQVGGPSGQIPHIGCPRSNGGFIAVHPFSGSVKKNWPLERYVELVHELDADVRFCAGPEQSLDGAVYMENLWDLACWLAAARLYVGNDSGITHLAAAVGTPTVAVFGPTDACVWAPRGRHVTIIHAPDLLALPVRTVLEIVTGRLRTIP